MACAASIFPRSNNWAEKIVGGWSLSGIFNWHSGFPYSPFVSVLNGSLYCGQCGYGQLLPAAYWVAQALATSSDAFKTEANSNFPKGPTPYPWWHSILFNTNLHCFHRHRLWNRASSVSGAARTPSPAGIQGLDLTLSKGFSLPSAGTWRKCEV